MKELTGQKVDLATKLISCNNPSNPKVRPIKTQQEVVAESVAYAAKRARGEFNYMKTRFSKLNTALGGGIEPNTIMTIGALSSGGKTTLGAQLCNSMCAIPTNKPAIVLNFNFEMLAHKQVGREICHLAGISSMELYNGNHTMTPEKLQVLVDRYYKEVINYPILYVEEPSTYSEITATILHWWQVLCEKENITLIVLVDHAGIVTGNANDKEKDRIDNLMQALNHVKKTIASKGGEAIYIVLSQMNRDIGSVERKTNPSLHYPQNSDLFASSAIEFYSDYILFTHNPSKLNLESYTESSFPVWLGSSDKSNKRERPFIYWSITKNREGMLWDVIPMIARFENFTFDEVTREDFENYHSQWKIGKCAFKI